MKLKFIISLVLVAGFFAFFNIALARTIDKSSQGIGEDKKKASTLNKEVDVVDESESLPSDSDDSDDGENKILAVKVKAVVSCAVYAFVTSTGEGGGGEGCEETCPMYPAVEMVTTDGQRMCCQLDCTGKEPDAKGECDCPISEDKDGNMECTAGSC